MEISTVSENLIENEEIENETEETESTPEEASDPVSENPLPGEEIVSENTESVSDNEQAYENSISGSDLSPDQSVSSGDVYYEITMPEITMPEEVPFFEKSFQDYTVTEGLLLLIFIGLCISTLVSVLWRK